MTKQVQTSKTNKTSDMDYANTAPAAGQQRNLYVTINTYDQAGKQVGVRVVDMYHYGTCNWLQSHMWWAVHHGHTTETMIANDAEVADYVKLQEIALAEKYNSDQKASKAA